MILAIFLGMCACFTILFGGYMYTQNEPTIACCVILCFGMVSLLWLLYEFIKDSKCKECDKCEGTGYLPRDKCSECGREK